MMTDVFFNPVTGIKAEEVHDGVGFFVLRLLSGWKTAAAPPQKCNLTSYELTAAL